MSLVEQDNYISQGRSPFVSLDNNKKEITDITKSSLLSSQLPEVFI